MKVLSGRPTRGFRRAVVTQILSRMCLPSPMKWPHPLIHLAGMNQGRRAASHLRSAVWSLWLYLEGGLQTFRPPIPGILAGLWSHLCSFKTVGSKLQQIIFCFWTYVLCSAESRQGISTKSGIFKEDPGYVRLNYGPQMTPISQSLKPINVLIWQRRTFQMWLRVERPRGSAHLPSGPEMLSKSWQKRSRGSLTGTEGETLWPWSQRWGNAAASQGVTPRVPGAGQEWRGPGSWTWETDVLCSSAAHLSLGFWPLERWKNQFLLLSATSLWYFFNSSPRKQVQWAHWSWAYFLKAYLACCQISLRRRHCSALKEEHSTYICSSESRKTA